MAVGRKFSYFPIHCTNYPPWMKTIYFYNVILFQYWIKNKGKTMPVVEPIKEEDWMWFRFVACLHGCFSHWPVNVLNFLTCWQECKPRDFCFLLTRLIQGGSSGAAEGTWQGKTRHYQDDCSGWQKFLCIVKCTIGNSQERNWVTVEGLNLKYETIAASGMIEIPNLHAIIDLQNRRFSWNECC